MPEFLLTSPEGKQYRVTGPEGSTGEQALQQLQSQLGGGQQQASQGPLPSEQEGPQQPMAWGDVAKGAARNFVPSAKQFGHDIIQPVVHPIETAKNLGGLAAGGLEMAARSPVASTVAHAIPGVGAALDVYQGAKAAGAPAGNPEIPKAVGQFFADRYGGMENLKRTMATDPVGFASDLSAVLSGGGGIGARAPGIAGTVGRAVQTAGRVVDPLTAPLEAGKLGAQAVGAALSKASPVAGQSIRVAAGAGAEGGARGQAFQESLRGNVTPEAAIEEARQGIKQMRTERGSAYVDSLAAIKADTTPLMDFTHLDDSITKIEKGFTYKGQDLSDATARTRYRVQDMIEGWKQLPDAERTAESLDFLKKQLGVIKEDMTAYSKPERAIATTAYNGVRQTIVDAFPEYAKVMNAYDEARRVIQGIEKELIGKPNASVDTALRRLQTILKDNVSGNFSRRQQLAEYLTNAGAPHLLERLAGQAMNPIMPRTFGKAIGSALIGGGGAALGGVLPAAGLYGVAALPLASPRVLGEGAYYAGKASQLPGRAIGDVGYQAGRLSSQLSPREIIKHEAEAALKDKTGISPMQVDELRAVARGKASVDAIQRTKNFLELRSKRLDLGKDQSRVKQSYGGIADGEVLSDADARPQAGQRYAMMDDPRAVRNKGVDQFGNQMAGGGGKGGAAGGSLPSRAPTKQQELDAVVANIGNPQGLRAWATRNGVSDEQVFKMLKDTYDHLPTAQKAFQRYMATKPNPDLPFGPGVGMN